MEKFRGYNKIGFHYSRALGGRSQSAGVSLFFSTNETYEFVSTVRWPETDFSGAVERGVREGLLESGYDPNLGVKVSLDDVEYDQVNSSEHAFYVAARCAAKGLSEIKR